MHNASADMRYLVKRVMINSDDDTQCSDRLSISW